MSEEEVFEPTIEESIMASGLHRQFEVITSDDAEAADKPSEASPAENDE